MSTQAPPAPERYVSVREFCDRSTLCRASAYNLVKRGELSKPRRLLPRRVGWPSTEIDAWFAARGAADQVPA